MSSEPLLVVLSGPSGVGKDSILGWMRERELPFHYTVTATTRPRRENERDGRDYHFYAREDFERLLSDGGLLEHALVYGDEYYGVPRQQVIDALRQGQDVIMRTNVDGAESIRAAAPGAVLIFIKAPSLEDLQERLQRRHTESSAEMAVRLGKAKEELERLPLFDYVVDNVEGKLDACVCTILAIVRAEKCRVRRPPLGLL